MLIAKMLNKRTVIANNQLQQLVMKVLFLLLPLLVVSEDADITTSIPLEGCLGSYDIWCYTRTPNVLVVDSTSYSARGLMDKQYHLLLENYLPHWHVENNTIILSYGDGSSLKQNYIANQYDACEIVQNKYSYSHAHFAQSGNVPTTVDSIYSLYNKTAQRFIFFSSSTWAYEIAATKFPKVPTLEVGVVDWSGQQMWRDRKNNGDIDFLMEVYDDSSMNDIALCLSNFTCNAHYSKICSANTLRPSIYTTDPSTTLVPTSEPSSYNPLSEEPQCGCDVNTVWVDVMLVFDSSVNAAANKRAFLEIVSDVKSDMAWLPIETSSSVTQYHTRIGMISYGNEAHIVSTFGSQNRAAFENQEVLYTQDPKTNISDALRLAINQFDSNTHRPNVRPVIVLVANTFTSGEVSPLAQAAAFKNNGGIIVIYYFDAVVPRQNLYILQQIASPGYFIYNNQESEELPMPLLWKAMCDANCFCPNGYSSPMGDRSRGYPIAGCHTASNKKANKNIAQNNCQLQNNGFISTAKYRQKSEYLESLMGGGNKFWLGLTYNKNSDSYVWSDGTPLNGTWHPWAANRATSTDACVVEVNLQWTPLACSTSYNYMCETAPCSSALYCEQDN